MNKRELANMINDIQIKKDHLKRMRYWAIYSTLTSLIAIIVAWWGFSHAQDPLLPNLSASIRLPIAWISIVIGVLTLLFAILVFIALRNGKKHILDLVDQLEKRK